MTNDRPRDEPLRLGVVLGDPRLPYPYAVGGRFGEDEEQAARDLESALQEIDAYEVTYFDDHARLIDALRSTPLDLVLNLCDTGFKNRWVQERNVVAFLEMIDLPFTGADTLSMCLAFDKALVRSMALGLSIPVPNEILVDLTHDPPLLPTSYPSIVKPNSSAGSYGVTEDSLVHDPVEAEKYLRWLGKDLEIPEALVQDYLTGAEYTVGLIGNPNHDIEALPPLEIDFGSLDPALPKILTHGSKADPESPYWQKLEFRQADIDEVTWARMVGQCIRLFTRLGFKDYARFDFRCGADGLPRMLDANSNPTWYANGKMALMSSWTGYDYPAMLEKIIESAAARYGL